MTMLSVRGVKLETIDELIAAGLAFIAGLGGLFMPPDVMQAMPLTLRLLVQQPVILGGLTLVVLYSLLSSLPVRADTGHGVET